MYRNYGMSTVEDGRRFRNATRRKPSWPFLMDAHATRK